MAPNEGVERAGLRIEETKELLATTAEPTEAVGYRDPAFLRCLVERRAGVTPACRRQRFQGIGRRVA